ncbi:MAG TPA: acetoacetate decarboxylase [Xanthobacteraceae bacterium]|jgi:acetoacetate decarboxylase|nr:acetoacetate decarboxylase [Xanthobacteraceae bacterium]
MKKQDVIALASMPLQSPTYPRGPYRFFDRQYLVIGYQTDPDVIRAHLPEPLEVIGDTVSVQWLDLPDGEGFGAYSATAQIIPCSFKGEICNFVSQMYVDNTPPLSGGREIWGYPMKYGKAELKVEADTLTGTLHYAGQEIAVGTMVYKHDAFRKDCSKEHELLSRTQITLKLIPDIDGKPAIAQLVGINFADLVIKGAWSGAARLEMMPSVNCPLADLPVKKIIGGMQIVTDMTLPYGRVLHDYLAK